MYELAHEVVMVLKQEWRAAEIAVVGNVVTF